MKKIYTQQKGYALLFTVIIVSIVSSIAVGLSNATYKQMVLSSIARDSQTAFYQADMITECIEYQDNVVSPLRFPMPSAGYANTTFTCGLDETGTDYYNFTVSKDVSLGADAYSVNLTVPKTVTPCSSATVIKNLGTYKGDSVVVTTISGKGYNICSKSNTRTLERTIEVTY